MPSQHAFLTASGSSRWINCPPSARLEENFPNETSEYAEEGTAAHELCEYKVRKYLNERVQMPQSDYYTEEIIGFTDIYEQFVIETVEQYKSEYGSPLVMVEEKLDFSHLVPGGFGTGDCVIACKGLIHIIDFKTGYMPVSSHRNTQMMLYASGALNTYGYLFDIKTVRMTIVQPRIENISSYELSADELIAWGESIKPIAQMAFEGKGEQKPGEWCHFCRAKAVCKARADEALALVRAEFLDLDEGVLTDAPVMNTEKVSRIDKVRPADHEMNADKKMDKAVPAAGENTPTVDKALNAIEETDVTAPYNPDRTVPTFKSPALISQAEIEEILPTLNRIQNWIESVFAYVASEAINHGVQWKGYKVVEGRSKREFTDTKAVINAAAEAGYTDVYKKTLITLTEFEKLLGKKKFAEVLGKYVVKPPGKPSLVPESDERPAMNSKPTVSDEFESLD